MIFANPNVGITVRSGCKDNFHAFMVKNAEFDGKYDIPYVPCKMEFSDLKDLIPYDRTYMHNYSPGEVVHFYLDDQKIDGPNGIWNGLVGIKKSTRGFDLKKI